MAGPLGIDYKAILLSGDTIANGALLLLLVMLWVLMLTSQLAHTASTYLSPTLASMCLKMRLPYNIAGVTFLAFGNGAPDVFSSISSFSGSSDILVGIGALLGGSFFVSTIVVGSIAVLSPCYVKRGIFLRDITFHIVAVSSVTVIAIMAEVTLFFALCLFCLYLLYVIVVFRESLVGISLMTSSSAPSEEREERGDGIDIPLTSIVNRFGTQLQTAFWHKDHYDPLTSPQPEKGVKGGGRGGRQGEGVIEDGQSSTRTVPTPRDTKATTKDTSSNPTGYKFLILEEDSDEDDENDVDHVDEDGTMTINLSGGLISPQFNAAIIDDYLGSDTVTSSKNASNGVENNLTESLIDSSDGGYARSGSSRGGSGMVHDIVSKLYWHQHILRRRLHRSLLSSEWLTYSISYKLLTIVESPFTLARDATIPTVDAEMWSKPFALVQPIFAPLFFLYVTGSLSNNRVRLSLIVIVFGAFGSFAVYLLTHHHRPPKSRVFNGLWLLLAFFMCVCWIYALAKELVTCLADIGDVYNISPAYLGLTVLAWGNSVGDLFSNTSVAKQGLGEMAIAGCYGGPVFNILVGLGLSISVACIKSYPAKFDVVFDLSSVVSLVFLFISLLSTVAIVVWRDYLVERTLGYYLIALYAVYTVVQLIIVSTAPATATAAVAADYVQ